VPVLIYAHLSWTTFARLPLVDDSVAGFLRKFVPEECARQGARAHALGVVRDHVHVVLELRPEFNVPRLVQGLKGASARIANRDGFAQRPLRWAQGYDFRSVSPRSLDAAIRYVASQAARHPHRALSDDASFRTRG
jgi:REP-associated tyrosine transposase